MHRALDVFVYTAPLPHGADDGSEVVVGQNQVGGLLGHVGAAPAHCTADVCSLERGRVVHAVAGHRHDEAAGLQLAYDAQLELGCRARKDGVGEDSPAPLGLFHRQQFTFGHGAVPLAADTDAARDGDGGVRVVAGDHYDLDSCAAASLDRFIGLRARRIDQSGQAAEGVRQLFGGCRLRCRLGVGEAEYAQRPPRHLRRLLRHAAGAFAHWQYNVRRAFEYGQIAFLGFMYGDHKFPF